MGIMTRMLRLCKADVHGVMDQLEDKALLLKQYLREMEAGLGLKEQRVNSLAQQIDRLNRRIATHRDEADKLERDLALALKKGKDDLARMLIRKRRTLVKASLSLKEQVEAMTRERDQLSETLAEQRLQYETLKVKADAYCRRNGDDLMDDGAQNGFGQWVSAEPDETEIELELLERKEALQKGGTP